MERFPNCACGENDWRVLLEQIGHDIWERNERGKWYLVDSYDPIRGEIGGECGECRARAPHDVANALAADFAVNEAR